MFRSNHIVASAVFALLAACSVAPEGVSTHDPYENVNRKVHDFNVGLDRVVLRPASQVTSALPHQVTDRVVDFSDNLALPGMIVNGVLQGDFEGAGTNTVRFIVNTIIGLGGLFDPADRAGIYEESTDFGETLAVWGAPEGAFVMLPVLGPSTERDAVGEVVDIVFDPLGFILPTEVQPYATGAKIGEKIVTRGNFGSTVDSVLYESADSYAQTRGFYLDNRRYDLGVVVEDNYLDPYADPYFDPYEDQ